MLQFDEKISPQMAYAILGDSFDPGFEYYLYSSLSEMSIRAVFPQTGEEVWSESKKVDTEDVVVPRRSVAEPKHYGHWFNGDYVTRRHNPVFVGFGVLLVLVAVFMFYVMGRYITHS